MLSCQKLNLKIKEFLLEPGNQFCVCLEQINWFWYKLVLVCFASHAIIFCIGKKANRPFKDSVTEKSAIFDTPPPCHSLSLILQTLSSLVTTQQVAKYFQINHPRKCILGPILRMLVIQLLYNYYTMPHILTGTK